MTEPLARLLEDTDELRKARGAFFTPKPVTDFMSRWAIRSPNERILEPSCGDAEFLLSAAARLEALGADKASMSLTGIELHEQSARQAQRRLANVCSTAEVRAGDFFGIEATGDYDVVLGNPPYIRFQEFGGAMRANSRAAALRGGVNLSALASSWASFVIHSALFLKPGGRLALVLPAELLSVNYASEIRRFLFEQFAAVRLVMFQERVFSDALEEVVLLLAEGFREGQAEHADVQQVVSAADLNDQIASRRWSPNTPDAKWTSSLIEGNLFDTYTQVVSSDLFDELSDWGSTTLGMVTGNNKFFTMSPTRATELGLGVNELVPISPPGSRHLKHLSLTTKAHASLGAAGAASLLFRPLDSPSDAALKYIEAGETAAVDEAYKCRIRKPWWRVPLVRKADLFLTYMSAEAPRLVTNTAGVHHLNSVHGVSLSPERQTLGKRHLALASLNSVSMLGAEIVGRSYGGGMLKIEPGEAKKLPLPSLELVSRSAPALSKVRRRVQTLLANRRLLDATAIVDDVLFGSGALAGASLDGLRSAREEMNSRRKSRGSDPKGV